MTRTPQQVGGGFLNVCVFKLQGPAVNLGGICPSTEARLSEILPVKHQRQAMLPWQVQLAFQPQEKEKPQENGLGWLQRSDKRGIHKRPCKNWNERYSNHPRVLVLRSSNGERNCARGYTAVKKLKVCKSVLWSGLVKSVCY